MFFIRKIDITIFLFQIYLNINIMAMDSLVPSPWSKFPFSHHRSFHLIVQMLDTHSILNCRLVCTDWKDWFTATKSLWNSVLHQVVARAFRRKVKFMHEHAWDIRLDLLPEIVDECCTEEQYMSVAIKVERATRQKIWVDFKVS